MFKTADRVKETSITLGTADVVLTGAFSNSYQTFLAGIGDGNSTYYVIENPVGWETGIGTYDEATNTLSRDTVLTSSTGGEKIELRGVSTVFCGLSSSRSVFTGLDGYLDLSSSGNMVSGIIFPDGSTLTSVGADATSISGWASSAILNGDVAVSGWANIQDIALSGWVSSFPNAGAVSGWAASTIVNGDNAISGWSQSTITNSGLAISGYLQTALTSLSTGLTSTINSVSGWTARTIENSGNILTSGYQLSDASISGWATHTISQMGTGVLLSAIDNDVYYYNVVTNAFGSGDVAISGWAKSTIDASGNILNQKIDSVSGWANTKIILTATGVLESAIANDTYYADLLTNAYQAADISISGWAQSTIDNSGVIVSGYARNEATGVLLAALNNDVLVSGNITYSYQLADAAISGYNKAYTDAAVLAAGGYTSWGFSNGTTAADQITNGLTAYVSGISGIQVDHVVGSQILQVSAQPISGYVQRTIENSGNALITLYSAADVSFSGWAQRSLENSGNALITGYTNADTAVSGFAAGTLLNGDNAVSGWANARDTSISGWIQRTVENSGNTLITGYTNADSAVSGFAAGTLLNGDNAVSGWANARDGSVSGWAFSTLNSSGTNISGWASNNAINISGWSHSDLTTGTNTLTNKRITPRNSGMSNAGGTPVINTDLTDIVTISGQKVNITSFSSGLTGTPTPGQMLIIAVAGASGAITFTWGSSFESSTITLPTGTVTTARLDMGFIWNDATSKWRILAVA